jgi:hypothetical protein
MGRLPLSTSCCQNSSYYVGGCGCGCGTIHFKDCTVDILQPALPPSPRRNLCRTCGLTDGDNRTDHWPAALADLIVFDADYSTEGGAQTSPVLPYLYVPVL